ncbi:U-box domain-containing protein 21-like [Mercurialis annua]|uniref:U-box domain-containing protein 21-like n=1 Tax=Mercurialis annua TaxID=3986 RepID=UPI00215FEC3B|nr:U-box domain-containing protein 21-like [Mercurialis annua]
MVFGWRRKRSVRNSKMEVVIPNHFICPISLDLMKDPVTLSSGITYDRENIESWLEDGNFMCPVSNQMLNSFDQIPNHTLREMIQDWCVANRNKGVQRIPTPRVPVSATQVSEILSCLEASTKRLDRLETIEIVRKIKKWGNESERNRRCIIANGASGGLAATLHAFARDSNNDFQRNATVFEEILSAMSWMMSPMLNIESQIYLGSQESLNSMVWLLEHRDNLSSKQNSINTLKYLLSSDQQHAESLASIEGINDVLFKLIKRPICPKTTKASLIVIFHLLSSDQTKSKFVKLGLVSLVIEIIIEGNRSVTEKALGVFDKLCDIKQGREEAYSNALTWPVLVKKMLRVSDLATEYSVSAIWKLNKNGRQEETAIEALQVGAFQKLVLLLQVGCGDETKEKATELLKMMNPYRNGVECIESVDFKNLKRSF